MTGISGGIAFAQCLVELTDYPVELDKLAECFGRRRRPATSLASSRPRSRNTRTHDAQTTRLLRFEDGGLKGTLGLLVLGVEDATGAQGPLGEPNPCC